MSKTLRCNLFSERSIQNIVEYLNNYSNALEIKCDNVVKELTRIGFTTAEYYRTASKMGAEHVLIEVKMNKVRDGCEAVIIATNKDGEIHVTWKGSDGGDREEDVSPILMVEYGSGLKARPEQSVGGIMVGQGTFPNQTHATDPKGWWWKDEEGNWHHSTGIQPTMPMYMAMIEMFTAAEQIVKSVFRG